MHPCTRGAFGDLWLTWQPVWQAFDDLDAPPERVTGAEVPMPYAANLEAAALPQARRDACCNSVWRSPCTKLL